MSNDKAPFSWEDPFYCAQLSEEERLILDSARDYAQDKLLRECKGRFERKPLIARS